MRQVVHLLNKQTHDQCNQHVSSNNSEGCSSTNQTLDLLLRNHQLKCHKPHVHQRFIQSLILRSRWISQSARKLVQTSTIKKKNIYHQIISSIKLIVTSQNGFFSLKKRRKKPQRKKKRGQLPPRRFQQLTSHLIKQPITPLNSHLNMISTSLNNYTSS